MKNNLFTRGLAIGIIILFLGASFFPSMGGISIKKQGSKEIETSFRRINSRGNILYVGGSGPNNYTKIQDAIDNASDGYTVFVFNDSSPYYENIIVNKSINLNGEDRNTTVIDGNKTGDVVYINADWVNISGFKIQYSGSDGDDRGIEIRSNHSTITDNYILSNTHYGVYIYSSEYNDNNITGNYLTGNGCGIYLGSTLYHNITGNSIISNTRGIILDRSRYNIIKGNNINSNSHYGIHLTRSRSNNMIGNNINSNNDKGIIFHESSSNTIADNNIRSNKNYGIHFYSRSSSNAITHNNISSNKHTGIYIYGYCDSNSFTGNNVISNYYYGIYIYYRCNSNIISNNTISSHNYYGIYIYEYCNSNSIIGNKISSNKRDGIYIYYVSKSNSIQGNNISNNGYSLGGGIFIDYYSDSNTITENDISSNDDYGIYLKQSSGNTIISDNYIDSNNNIGIHLYSGSDSNSITGNNIISNKNDGIRLSSSRINTITGNNISSNLGNGLYLEGTYSNNILDNNISSNKNSGLFLASNSNSIKDNNITNSNIGLNLYNSNDNGITSNNITNNGWGIYLRNSYRNNISGNNVVSNSDYGIYLYYYSRYNIIYNNYFYNTRNAFDDDVYYGNTWSISKTPGKNIIGGDYLGGNWWSDYYGEDEDGDGLGDTKLPYDSNGEIVDGGDWLPLFWDIFPPEILDNTPNSGFTGDPFTFNASVIDYVNLSTVWIEYWHDDGDPTNESMTNVGGDYYEKNITTCINCTVLHYLIAANDTYENWNITINKNVTLIDNDDPEIFDNTPSVASAGHPFTFNVKVMDNIGVSRVWVEFWYDDSYHNNFSMINIGGDYWERTITVDPVAEILHYIIAAVDSTNNWANTEVNDVPIIPNDPPNPPNIVGPTSGKVGVLYEYTFNATDPNGDNISYFIDWGDETSSGWTEYTASGTEVKLKHTWSEQGTYIIRAKAKDIFGLDSNWGELTVTMPRNKVLDFILNLLNWLSEQFPILGRLLNLF